MIALAALCLAASLGVALLIMLIARAMGWRRRRIGMLVRPWLFAILLLLTIGLTDAARGGLAALDTTGWALGSGWLMVSLATHLVGRSRQAPHPARLWGARLAHGGVAIAVGGILLSVMLASTSRRSLAPGDQLRFMAWTVQLHEVWPTVGTGWTGVEAELRASSGAGVIVLDPQVRSGLDGSVRSRGARASSGSGALTAILGPRDREGRWPVTFGWTPLLVLIPLGLIVSALGLILAMVGQPAARWRRLRQARLATAWWA